MLNNFNIETNNNIETNIKENQMYPADPNLGGFCLFFLIASFVIQIVYLNFKD